MRVRHLLIPAFVFAAGCGDDPVPQCEVTEASVEPGVYRLNEDETVMEIEATTDACDPEAVVEVRALVRDELDFHIIDLQDDGLAGDVEAGDRVFQRSLANPFIGPDQVGEGVLRFRTCTPDCVGTAVEVPVRIDPAPKKF